MTSIAADVNRDISVQAGSLPQGYDVLRLHEQPAAEQARLLPLLFTLIQSEYSAWLGLETTENWLACLAEGNARGTRMAVSLVLDAGGAIAGASATEIYANGTAIVHYSVGRRGDAEYLKLVAAATLDMVQALRVLQGQGLEINLLVKEHHLDSARAHAGYLAVGQVPLDGPTSLLRGAVKFYEVACGDPSELEDPVRLEAAMALTDPQTPRLRAGLDDEVHLWLVGDFVPSRPEMSLARNLRLLAEGYAGERSIFRMTDLSLDPGWQSLQRLADLLPPDATYRQAVEASRLGAARFMGLEQDWLLASERI